MWNVTRLARWISAATLAVVCALALVHAQRTEFRKGQVEIRRDDHTYTAPLFQIEGGSTLQPMGKDRWLLGLVYRTARDAEPHVAARMALTGLTGPGNYVNKDIGNLVVEVDTDVWNFDSSQHTCTVTMTRLQGSGVEGSVACAGEGVPFSQLRFTATP